MVSYQILQYSNVHICAIPNLLSQFLGLVKFVIIIVSVSLQSLGSNPRLYMC